MTYALLTATTAPEAARDTLAAAQKVYGFLPNLLAVMAASPALVKAYVALSQLFDETSLSPAERQTVLLTVSYENNCDYCVAAHSTIAAMQKVDERIVQAIRGGRPIHDPKLEALRRFTAAVVTTRGYPSDADTISFRKAGYDDRQVLEVILGVGLKTLSNYTTHITETPLDQVFAKASWSKAA